MQRVQGEETVSKLNSRQMVLAMALTNIDIEISHAEKEIEKLKELKKKLEEMKGEQEDV